MKWQIRIQEPSGEVRVIPFLGPQILGRSDQASIPLRDPTVAPEALVLQPDAGDSDVFWMRAPEGAPSVRVGDLRVREGELPSRVNVQVGETCVRVEPVTEDAALPPFPSGVRPWLTCSTSGKDLLWATRKTAATPLSVYLAGETGTGKEVLSQLLHSWSGRAAGPFVPLHCGALPLSLAESELFGHVKGAFTGAIQSRPGALMQAHGGTLFLDEIGDLPVDIQVKLLRFLENGEIRPVGSDRTSRADVRLVCATHHPLLKLVEEGRFRRDLYYRLASVTLEIPPLRHRPEDIAMLSRGIAAELSRAISPRALLRLQAHAWPGNVRELRHAIERASGLAGPFTPVLNEEAFDFLLTPLNIAQAPELELGSSVLSLEEMERHLIIKALKLSDGNRAKAARLLGIARSTLFEMLKRHNIRGPRAPESSADEDLAAG
jgi:transcriptional regulator with PAS, ATPase and Fis domain